ncbi:hypothetical protein FNV43_RR27257 [Rhamnella rubrinervis]|uniref:Uncharacterized protein n=1 Tax=Rhamnella rubrinervis TaxID=2594499 RepID=A0A8K0DWK1_9ROSA|nr:hypothetical protein FNV43_RR27257 [Rhamnella rubrinervis]
MPEMMTKKWVSNLVVLVVAMILMANYFVSCGKTNIGDVGSDDYHHDYHNDGNNVKESHDLIPHHHHNDGHDVKESHDLASHRHDNGVRKMAEDGCPGGFCFFITQSCHRKCFCFPIPYSIGGFCVGSCGCDNY